MLVVEPGNVSDIVIYNIVGEQVECKSEINGSSRVFRRGGEAAGVYFVRLPGGKTYRVMKY